MSKHKKRKNVVNTNGTIIELVTETDDTYDIDVDSDEIVDNDVSNSDELTEDPVSDNPVIDGSVDNSNTTPSDHNIDNQTEDSHEMITGNTETIENSTIIQPASTVLQQVNFYKVGTDYVNGKCINQVTSTTDLGLAKKLCSESRDNYKKSYHVFDKIGNAVYTSEYSAPKDNYYRVGTDWKNGACINQKFSSTNIDLAREQANVNTKTYGVIYNVYDPSGKVVFSSKKKLTLLSLKKRGNKNDSWYT